ncbi:MAG: hypothetical protein CMJ18_17515 [Phycisphaeraceae bacterium]|nr:hypothetical protein [Phycisphaeraceae bacterium]
MKPWVLLTDLVWIALTSAALVILIAIIIPTIAVPVGILAPIALLVYVGTIPFGGVYRFALTRRYLRQKLIPLFAAAAVALCTAMVIIVISVMGGFLSLLTEAVQKLEASMTITSSLKGFPHYDQLRSDLEKLDEVEAAAAVIRTYGLINIELGEGQLGDEQVIAVEILGIDPESFSRVMEYRDVLHWNRDRAQEVDAALREIAEWGGQRRPGEPVAPPYTAADLENAAMTFETPKTLGDWPALVLGIAVSPTSRRNEKGEYDYINSIVGMEVVLTAVSVAGGSMTPVKKQMTVVNEFKSGLYEVDNRRVYVDFEVLQEALLLSAYDGDDEEGNPLNLPARTTEVVVRARDDVPLDLLAERVETCAAEFISRKRDMPMLRAYTWRQRHATFLGAVEKEKMMLTMLFAIISVIAVAMIAVVFYMIVLDKTRDVGVLRAMGASRAGVASIFLGYGLAIGLIGSILGLGFAAAIVYNLNEIQAFLTERFGFTMWDPSIYFFDRIPARLDPVEVPIIMFCAVLAGLVGAVVPAVRAARLDPVEALRYE